MRKYRITKKQYSELSKKAQKKWYNFCVKNDLAIQIGASEYIIIEQPDNNDLLLYCHKKKIEHMLSLLIDEPIDYLWILVKEHLEED